MMVSVHRSVVVQITCIVFVPMRSLLCSHPKCHADCTSVRRSLLRERGIAQSLCTCPYLPFSPTQSNRLISFFALSLFRFLPSQLRPNCRRAHMRALYPLGDYTMIQTESHCTSRLHAILALLATLSSVRQNRRVLLLLPVPSIMLAALISIVQIKAHHLWHLEFTQLRRMQLGQRAMFWKVTDGSALSVLVKLSAVATLLILEQAPRKSL